mgnify:CR=1 FL=1
MGIYMLVTPIYIFFINIIQLSLPTTIATKIAKNPKETNKIIPKPLYKTSILVYNITVQF